MKKILICLMLLLISSAAFADTLRVVKNDVYYSKHTYLRTYKNMKEVELLSPKSLNENEYMVWKNGIAYKVNGKTFWASVFEVEFD